MPFLIYFVRIMLLFRRVSFRENSFERNLISDYILQNLRPGIPNWILPSWKTCVSGGPGQSKAATCRTARCGPVSVRRRLLCIIIESRQSKTKSRGPINIQR